MFRHYALPLERDMLKFQRNQVIKHYISAESTACRSIQILTRGVATPFERHVNMSKRDLTVDITMSVKLASSLRDEIPAAHLHCWFDLGLTHGYALSFKRAHSRFNLGRSYSHPCHWVTRGILLWLNMTIFYLNRMFYYSKNFLSFKTRFQILIDPAPLILYHAQSQHIWNILIFCLNISFSFGLQFSRVFAILYKFYPTAICHILTIFQ
jgi:hypothetical protein